MLDNNPGRSISNQQGIRTNSYHSTYENSLPSAMGSRMVVDKNKDVNDFVIKEVPS